VRILVISNLYPNPRQPHRASFNRLQLAALAQEHEVRVIAPIAWTSGPPHGPRVSDGMIIDHPRYVYPPKVLRTWYGYLFEHSIRQSFYGHLKAWRPDVVLGCWGYPDAWAAERLAREVGLPVAVKLHGSDVLTLGRGARHARTVEVLRSADAVIAVSQNVRDKAIAIGAPVERTHLVYNGIDASIFHPGSRDAARRALNSTGSEPLIVFAGNLLPVKGVDVLIDALGRLHAAGDSFRCVCIGHGPLKGKLIAQIQHHGLSDRVQVLPPCPQPQLADWYRAADLFVLPSRSEGMPNVLLEAAACGTPFVASRVGGVAEVSDPAALVPAEDPRALADRIRHFLDPSKRPVLAAPFSPGSWQDSARSLAAVLQRIVRQPQSAAA
jgi:glycosyltransferase involved in cell wall biosynthesis